MAVLFQDAFDQGDGALGNGWTVDIGTADVNGGRLRGNTSPSRVSRNVPEGAGYDFSLELDFADAATFSASYPLQVWLRVSEVGTSYYRLTLQPGALGSAYLAFARVTPGGTDSLATYYTFTTTAGERVLTLDCVGSTIVARWNGVIIGAVSDAVITNGAKIRLYMNGANQWYIETVTIYSAQASAMTVVPSSMAQALEGQTLTLLGVGTQWTPGTPGSPEFTVSEGAITAQTVETQNRATLTYNAPVYPTVVIITDPDYGRTTGLAISSGSTLPPGPESQPGSIFTWLQTLNDQLIDLLNASADALTGGVELDLGESILDWVRGIGKGEDDQTLAELLTLILRHLDTDTTDPNSLRHIANEAWSEGAAAHTALGILTEAYTLTLQDVIDASGGSGGTYSVDDVHSLVQDVLTLLGTVAGTPTDTLASLLSAIGTVQSDVTVVSATADGIDGKVDALTGEGTYNLSGLLAAEGAVGVLATAGLVVAIVGLVRGTAATAIQTVDLVEDVIADGTNWAAVAGHVLGFLSDYSAPSPASLGTDLSTVINDIGAVSTDLGEAVTTITEAISGTEIDLASKLDAIEGKIDALTSALAALSAGGPLWPGLDSVTLGTPVDITESMRIETPLQGILYHITSVTPGARHSDIGGSPQVQALGICTFETDSGHVERFQTLSFYDCVITPKAMLQAAAVVLEWRPGTVGTVTPWVVDAS